MAEPSSLEQVFLTGLINKQIRFRLVNDPTRVNGILEGFDRSCILVRDETGARSTLIYRHALALLAAEEPSASDRPPASGTNGSLPRA